MKEPKLSFRSIAIILSATLTTSLFNTVTFLILALTLFIAFSIDKKSLSYSLNYAYTKNPNSLKPHFSLLKNDLFLVLIGVAIGSFFFLALQFLSPAANPAYLISIYKDLTPIGVFKIKLLSIPIVFLTATTISPMTYPNINPKFKVAIKKLKIIRAVCFLLFTYVLLPLTTFFDSINILVYFFVVVFEIENTCNFLSTIIPSLPTLPFGYSVLTLLAPIIVVLLVFLSKRITKQLPSPLSQLVNAKFHNKTNYLIISFFLLSIIINLVFYPHLSNIFTWTSLAEFDPTALSSLYIKTLLSLIPILFIFIVSTIYHYLQLLPTLPNNPKKIRQSIFINTILYSFFFSPFVLVISTGGDAVISRVTYMINLSNYGFTNLAPIISKTETIDLLNYPNQQSTGLIPVPNLFSPFANFTIQLLALLLLSSLFTLIGLLITKSKSITPPTPIIRAAPTSPTFPQPPAPHSTHSA